MEILLVERDRLVRDQIKVGLQQFPEFQVTTGEGYAALNELHQRDYDAVFLGAPQKLADAARFLEHMRSIDREAELIVVASERQARDMARDKAKYNVFAFLTTPIAARDFFRLLGRLRERWQDAEPQHSRHTATRVGGRR